MRRRHASLPRLPFAAAVALGLVLAWLNAAPTADAQAVGADTTLTTYVLVRHAEKDTSVLGSDSPLDAKGLARAQELARLLGSVPFRRIYATAWQRTRRTAEPLATRRGDSLTVIDNVGKTLEALRAEPGGARVLVVGHSNTVPKLIEGLTGRPFSDRVSYDGMWIVTRAADGGTSVLSLRYGAPDQTPPEPAAASSAPSSSVSSRADSASTLTTYVLVRHAEKDSGRADADVPLKARGRVRAQELARVLGEVRFGRIHSTHWLRNRQTAEAVAADHRVSLTVIDEARETLAALRAEPRGSTVLVVGHIYTIAPLILGLTGRPFPIADRIDYDGLWIVTQTAAGDASLLSLRYGAPDLDSKAPAPAMAPARSK